MNKTRFEMIFFKKKRALRRAQGPSTLIKAKVPEPAVPEVRRRVEGPTNYKSLFLRILDVEAWVIQRNGRLTFQPIYLKQ